MQLDYIQALGFDAIWISPLVDNAKGGYHGYWQKNMSAINAHFGNESTLLSLSSAIHSRGMYLMVDVVANHASTGPVSDNYPFNTPDSYHDCTGCPTGCSVEDFHDLGQMEHCRLAGLMDFDNTEVDGDVASWLYSWIGSMVKDFGIDGLRVDTVPYVPPAVWQRFEAASGVFAVGEVDDGGLPFVAPFQAPNGSKAALSGVLSYPLFYTLRNVFQQGGSMRELGEAWRAGVAAYSDVRSLGVFTDNHDNPRFMSQGGADVGAYRAAIAYSILSDGIPILYYGSEWLLAGGGDPFCREPLWATATAPYNASAAPLGQFLAGLNAYRKRAKLWEWGQVERWQDDSYYAFSKGGSLAVFTNVGVHGSDQTRAITYLPEGWEEGTRACNTLSRCVCATVLGGVFRTPPLPGREGVAIYDPSATCDHDAPARQGEHPSFFKTSSLSHPPPLASPPSQLLLGYYSGVGLDSLGDLGLNSLALAFFDPLSMASPNCSFIDPSHAPCLTPAAGAGGLLSLKWVHDIVSAAAPVLSHSLNAGTSPVFLISFGGATSGGRPWDTLFGEASLASTFGVNCASLVAALSSAFPGVVFGIDLDVEGTDTPLPFAVNAVSAYRTSGAVFTHFPLQLCALSGLATPSSTDFFKLALLRSAGPAQGGISHVNLMVDNVDVACSTYFGWWNASGLGFLPPFSRLGGCWGEIFPSFILHPPGCVDGESPLFPFMKTHMGLAIWELWTGPVDSLGAVVKAVKAS